MQETRKEKLLRLNEILRAAKVLKLKHNYDEGGCCCLGIRRFARIMKDPNTPLVFGLGVVAFIIIMGLVV